MWKFGVIARARRSAVAKQHLIWERRHLPTRQLPQAKGVKASSSVASSAPRALRLAQTLRVPMNLLAVAFLLATSGALASADPSMRIQEHEEAWSPSTHTSQIGLSQPPASDVAAFCKEAVERAQETRQRTHRRAESKPEMSADSGRTPLPGMQFLTTSAAPVGLTRSLLGRPCAGDAHVWAIGVDVDSSDGKTHTLYAASDGRTFDLPDGRKVFIAPASEGDYHAADGSYIALTLVAGAKHRAAPFLMGGGGTWGGQGSLLVPAEQPEGAYHVWQQAGGMWQGYVQEWAGITDFAGPRPRAVGAFRVGASFPCQPDGEKQCAGGKDYDLTSFRYADGRPDELVLTWHLVEYDQNKRGARIHVRNTDLSATYRLRNGKYRLIRGKEPPGV